MNYLESLRSNKALIDEAHSELVGALKRGGCAARNETDCGIVLCCPEQDNVFGFRRTTRGWYISLGTGGMFRLADGASASRLCLALADKPPCYGSKDKLSGIAPRAIPESVRARFRLVEVTHREEEDAVLCEYADTTRSLWLAERFGFRPWVEVGGVPADQLQHAGRLVENILGHPAEEHPSPVLMNGDLVYLPPPPFTVGREGRLLHRSSGRLASVCSSVGGGLNAYVWGFYRGIPIFGATRDDRLVTFIIHRISSLKKTRELLSNAMRGAGPLWGLHKKLDSPPCVMRGVDLLLVIHELIEAEEEGYFEFEIRLIQAVSCTTPEPDELPPVR